MTQEERNPVLDSIYSMLATIQLQNNTILELLNQEAPTRPAAPYAIHPVGTLPPIEVIKDNEGEVAAINVPNTTPPVPDSFIAAFTEGKKVYHIHDPSRNLTSITDIGSGVVQILLTPEIKAALNIDGDHHGFFYPSFLRIEGE